METVTETPEPLGSGNTLLCGRGLKSAKESKIVEEHGIKILTKTFHNY